jgi:pimeloyl-ACP methyl ester carboxylesterase
MDTQVEIRSGRLINIFQKINTASDTTVFFIHGMGGRGQQWRNQISIFNGTCSLIIPDLFGLGGSAKPRSYFSNPYSFSELDKDIHALFDRYQSKKNIVLGHSYGGAFAVSLAFDHQDKINQLILIDPVRAEPKMQIPAVFHLPVFLLNLLRPSLEKDFNQAAFDVSTNPALIEEEIRASKANRLYVIKAMVNGMKKIRDIAVSKLDVPTLIVIGESDKVILPARIKEFYSVLPHVEFHMIQHAAHMPMLELPQITNEVIIQFLKFS